MVHEVDWTKKVRYGTPVDGNPKLLHVTKYKETIVSLKIQLDRFCTSIFKTKFWSKSSKIFLRIIISNEIGGCVFVKLADLQGH